MSLWVPEIESRRGPRYLAIADAIGEAIRQGELKPEERLPTHRDLAYHLGVTVGTVSRAYGEAVRRDYVIGEVGRGTYVKPEEDGTMDTPFHIPDMLDPNLIDFSMNIHSEGEGVEKLRIALQVLAQDPGLGALMRYQAEQGMEHHRVAMAKWAHWHGAPYDPDRIVVSNGVQHAMALSLMALCKAGDTLLCEEYSYPGIKTLATQLGVKMQGLPMDEHGLIPDRLEKAIVQTGARVLYCMPNYQNPTSVSMDLSRRQEIVEIAKRHGLWIIEDDIYGFVHEKMGSLQPFATLLPEQTFYLNGASKSISPGLRVGFALVPEQKVQTVAACVRLTNWMVAPLTVEILSRWIEDGTAQYFMDWHRKEASKRQEVMLKYITRGELQTSPNSYHNWFTLPAPWTAEMFCLRARERDVSIMPAHIFYIGKGAPVNAVRLCYGAPASVDVVEDGMSRLATLLNEEIHAFHSVM
ncbi:PLP-dependent aminotransferase family protein [Terasakiella sp. SH-1]|uniref:aminotransferase-like domain-containing protein n=1 Tax=Terasakiella sp. SH-1 TaxID=2560057 RepID=UPI0010740448|nr:PLP-dependent aminotransferase family protein [Terasakiella sp. SH-1]